MDRFYEESAADLMASYSRSPHGYEGFADTDDMEVEDEQIEEEFDELAETARQRTDRLRARRKVTVPRIF